MGAEEMTDRALLQQALEALEWVADERVSAYDNQLGAAILALRERLSRCDDCGKPLGGPNDLHTCSPQVDHVVDTNKKVEPEDEPFAYAYTGIKHDGSNHGPHLVWKPEYMDAMSASKGAVAVPLYTRPQPAAPATKENT